MREKALAALGFCRHWILKDSATRNMSNRKGTSFRPLVSRSSQQPLPRHPVPVPIRLELTSMYRYGNSLSIQRPPIRSILLFPRRFMSDSTNKDMTVDASSAHNEETRKNHVNIQMLPKNLHVQVFPEDANKAGDISPAIIEISKEHLRKHRLPFEGATATAKDLPDIKFELPKLQGKNIAEHFGRIGSLVAHPYKQLAKDFALSQRPIPTMPSEWSNKAGWTKYTTDGVCEVVEYPVEKAIVLDVETCPLVGDFPIMAVALSETAWYSWASPELFHPASNKENSFARLIRLGDSESVCIGHNVSYDRARVLDEYNIVGSKRRFIDTLSMHCAVSGLSSQQRAPWNEKKKRSSTETVEEADSADDKYIGRWTQHSSLNNLVDAYQLHCGKVLDKSDLQILLSGGMNDLRMHFQRLVTYCANDVLATAKLYRSLWPKFLKKCPHPVTFAAMLEMGRCFLPLDEGWKEYILNCETKWAESSARIEIMLQELVEQRVKEGQNNDAYKDDPWLKHLDWTPIPAKFTKPKLLKDGSYAKNGEPRPIGNAFLFGKPAWYKKLYNSSMGNPEITPRTKIVPYLLKMNWRGFPVHFINGRGWCYAVPMLEGMPEGETSKDVYMDPSEPDILYYRIPHHDREGENVGCLLTKNFSRHFEKAILTAGSDLMAQVMEANTMFSFWIGYRERIKSQMVVWDDEPGVNLNMQAKVPKHAGVILPTIIPMGTVTRRAVEATWMTASNSKKNLVGSELKSRIVAPAGYVFVGADVDSQELWISSMLSDAQFGFPGATAIGWMTLQGSKVDRSDLHSRTAEILGMSRDEAKIFNYGRIYGAGVKYASQLLIRFNPKLAPEEADKKARELYHATKGKKSRRAVSSEYCTSPSGYYAGGSESFMFNQMEAIARAKISRTPALDCEISDALISGNVDDQYLTSRINWVVQSSAVDYLHLLLASMRYLMQLYQIDGRLLITIHDEVRFMVKEADQYRLALALQVANLWTRALFSYRLDIHDLPLSCAFFSAIDFDHALRKEASALCLTPSNTMAVAPGYTLDIWELLQKTANTGLGTPDDKYIETLGSFADSEDEDGPGGLSQAAVDVTRFNSLEEHERWLENQAGIVDRKADESGEGEAHLQKTLGPDKWLKKQPTPQKTVEPARKVDGWKSGPSGVSMFRQAIEQRHGPIYSSFLANPKPIKN